MTCNQLMTLLTVHRGTIEQEFHIGTFQSDLNWLFLNQLITLVPETGEWVTTPRGTKLVETALALPLNP